MIRLGIDEFVRNIKRNIPVIIQISGVLVLLVLIISIYEVQTRMGFSVMDYIDDTGVYAELSGDNILKFRGMSPPTVFLFFSIFLAFQDPL